MKKASTRPVQVAFVLVGMLLDGAVLAAERSSTSQDDLAKAFRTPPREAQAWCYWWWLNGNASKEGITRDMEEMKKQGINGALLFDAGEGPGAPRGPHFMSPAWRELYKHALHEADRCGIVLTVNLCSGWNAGGPWVTPEHAAKKIVGAATTVKGPRPVSMSLPQPEKARGFYRDIAVLAYPVSKGGAVQPKLSASSSYREYLPALAQDGSSDTRWISNGDKPGMGPTPQKPEYLQLDYNEAFPAAGLYLQPYPDCGPKDIEIQCSDDGKSYRTLKRATVKPHREITLPFDEVRSKHFRVAFLSSHPYQGKENWNVQVAEIALLTRTECDRPVRRASGVWQRSQTVDLTKFADEGRLTWDAPAGTFSVLRIGYTLHGNMIKCVGSGPTGLEIDTMSAEAIDAHFAETGAKLIADAGPLVGKTLQYFHIDSWELGQPTWTPNMREEFQKRRGYDPLLYLPALLQRTVDDPQATQKFLADYRRTAADLVAANYYGRLRELSVKGGLRGTHPESGGPFFNHWIDALQCEGINDIPMGEFWTGHHQTVKQAANAAHIYGKPLCQAEAFTSMNRCDWTETPWNQKNTGDNAFCDGLTRTVLCFWVHQARPDAKPGFQWPHVGTHFDCNVTWWPLVNGWLTYQARCQYMLRRGMFVADYAFLRAEIIPDFISPLGNVKAAGFDYDWINKEVLLTRAAAKDGRLTLPDGMSYRYLVLPAGNLSDAALQNVNRLAEAGVPVIGPEVWRESIPKLRQGDWMKLGAAADRLPPDIEFRNATPRARFDWIHRRDGQRDIYFVVSDNATGSVTAHVLFRTSGCIPELWDPVTGTIRDLPQYQTTPDGRMEIPLKFASHQSWFVVFQKKSAEQGPATAKKNFLELKPVQELVGAWEVQFDPKWFYPDNGIGGKVRFEQLTDWTQRPEDAVKYYSGIATYKITFDLQFQNLNSRTFLDLGQVRDIARVKLNGRDLGAVWTAPWQAEIPAGSLKPSGNELEIAVANVWPNRLIGDAALPQEKRRTTTNVSTFDKRIKHPVYHCVKCEGRKKTGRAAQLIASGLLGPVRLMRAE